MTDFKATNRSSLFNIFPTLNFYRFALLKKTRVQRQGETWKSNIECDNEKQKGILFLFLSVSPFFPFSFFFKFYIQVLDIAFRELKIVIAIKKIPVKSGEREEG